MYKSALDVFLFHAFTKGYCTAVVFLFSLDDVAYIHSLLFFSACKFGRWEFDWGVTCLPDYYERAPVFFNGYHKSAKV